uniref:unspecific monooxygenase n=1 Tax=Ostrinia furnacalis TaxID=93504 RepID=A0A7S9GLF6_OSTFU|nr:cytochrome P450 monooxygenase CYP9A124 [Ostrinia furnacalis]
MGMLLYVWAATIVAAVWLYCRQVYSRFTRHGVKQLPPVPLLGNMTEVVFRFRHMAEGLEDLYKAFPEERFIGRFEFMSPMVMIRDLELIKRITVKDFEYFLDHRTIVNDKTDPLFGRNLFSLKGQEWKDMRSTLSPAFTSSKMRVMVPFMMEAGDQMVEALMNRIQESKENYIDIDCKDITCRYANDVIASCAFGLKLNSQANLGSEFYKRGLEASVFNFRQVLSFLIMANFPKLADLVNLTLFSEKSKDFFRSLVMNTMSNRETEKIFRPDMIHLLMEAKKGKLLHDEKVTQDTKAGFATVEESAVGKKNIDRVWSDNDLIAQAVLFFIAGFEGISAVMSFALHELAVNPDVQSKLVAEIKENDAKNGGKFDYKSIQEMTYMDMVVSEVLRFWSAGVALDRVCNKDYNLGKPNSQATEDYIVRKGEAIVIPVWAFHHDPQYFPNPDKFDPERFSEENKHKINPLAYMPFGLGPRNCIGSRFALCEVKVMLYQLLQHLEVFPAAKTAIPARLSTETFNLRMKGGHWIRLNVRE